MKSLVAIGALMLALSFCNLMGRRRSANNSNTRDSGSVAESSPAENSNAPEREQRPGTTIVGSSAPPSSAPGVRSAADEPPPPPPKQTKPTPVPIISGGVLNGKAIHLVQPSYPAIARAAHASGTVQVQVTIDENGNVISAHAVSGHPLLQASAIAAARASKFSPTKLSGMPVKVSGVLIYNFVAQ
jgi:TonB family protein